MHIEHSMDLNSTDPEKTGEEKSNIAFGTVALMFSVEDFDHQISIPNNDSVHLFFEHLKFDDLNEPIVDRVALGDMMKYVDMNQRWVYHGSLTTPPCTPVVYWNVINRIFPIKLEEFKKIKEVMEKRKSSIGATFNNRPIQPIINQGIRYLGAVYL